MKTCLAFVIPTVLLCSSFAAGQEAIQKRPNIVMLFIDDWAWNGTPVAMDETMENSRMPVLQMPNVERLAREGMKFRNAYASPQCSPSRVCLQTGQSSPRNGFTVYMNSRGQEYYDESQYHGFPVVPCVSDMTIDKNAVTIPEALKPLGYLSAHIGKWHMRGDPGDEGYVLHDGDTDNNPGNTLKAGLKEGEEPSKRLPNDITDPKLMFSITEKAIRFMDAQVKKGNPFYVQLSHYAMHEGRECLPATREKYVENPYVQAWYRDNDKTAETVNRKEDPAIWLGMADDLDGRIGAVLDKIDELGIADNTYVIMVADNGYRHEFLPELTQPLHARKWWVWEGGIRVPMIVKGPGIAPGSVFTGNVVNYDFLPTFVDWAGGDPNQLEDIDGVSLAPYLAGQEPNEDFLNRKLYFHYPHYRSTMPHTAMVSGPRKVLHFYEHPDIPMLFDLSKDIGEVRNLAEEYPEEHQKLFSEMMSYLEEVGGRLPKPNPDYDLEKYKADKDYWYRINWGPFRGARQLDDDEREPLIKLGEKENAAASKQGDDPQVRFTNLEDGAHFPARTDLRVEVDANDGDGIREVKLYLNGLMVNAQGMVAAPQVWSSSGDSLLKGLKPGRYLLEVVAKDRTGRSSQREIQITVGDLSKIGEATSKDAIHQVILNEGERMMAGETLKFKRLQCLLKLEDNGKLLLKDESRGKLFQTDSEGPDGEHFAALESGQLKIYRGAPNHPQAVLWESDKPKDNGPSKLGITVTKRLIIFRENESGHREVVWMSPGNE